MNNQNVSPSVLLYRNLFGKPIAMFNLCCLAAILSSVWYIVVEWPPMIPLASYPVPTIPADYAALAGVLFFMSIILRKPFLLLRYPREQSLPFIAGITYLQRQQLCSKFTKRKLYECLIFLIVFFAIRYALVFTLDKHITLIDLVFPEVPLFIVVGLLYGFSDKIVFSLPISKKETLSVQQSSSGSTLSRSSESTFIKFSKMVAFFSSGQTHTIIVRMVLYILRKDLWGTLFLQIAVLAASIVVASILPDSVELLVRVLLFAAPVLLLAELREAINDSISKAIECPYYYFSEKHITNAGIYMSCLVIVPYFLIYLTRTMIHLQHFECLSFVNCILSAIALCLVIGRSFFDTGKLGKGTGSATFFYSVPVVMCTLMPIIGIILSVLLIGFFLYKLISANSDNRARISAEPLSKHTSTGSV